MKIQDLFQESQFGKKLDQEDAERWIGDEYGAFDGNRYSMWHAYAKEKGLDQDNLLLMRKFFKVVKDILDGEPHG